MIILIYQRIIKLISRANASLGSRHTCYACGKKLKKFLPYRGGSKDAPIQMLKLNVVGSDIDNFECPRCKSHDRERHLLMYFDKLSIWKRISNGSILHFAPERNLESSIRKTQPLNYIKADLFPNAHDIQCEDITKLSFKDAAFDVVIANHVLEHVADDLIAMTELFRVLKPGGIAILQTPYSSVLELTLFNPHIKSKAERLREYGQEDHVRLYGQDIFTKICSVGFTSSVVTHDECLSEIDAATYGVNRMEPFFYFKKNSDLIFIIN